MFINKNLLMLYPLTFLYIEIYIAKTIEEMYNFAFLLKLSEMSNE
jgi:hypothetical protein